MGIFAGILLFLSCFSLLILEGSLYFIASIIILFCFIYLCFIPNKNMYESLFVSFLVLGFVLFANPPHLVEPEFLKYVSYISFGLAFIFASLADKNDSGNNLPPS